MVSCVPWIIGQGYGIVPMILDAVLLMLFLQEEMMVIVRVLHFTKCTAANQREWS